MPEREPPETSPFHVAPEPMLKVGKAERTRATIMNAAFDQIWQHPPRQLTVSALMASTSLSRATFYQYFSDIDELLAALLDLLQDEIFVAVEPWLAHSGDPVALLAEMLTGLVRVCRHRGPFLRAVSDAAATHERHEGNWKQFLVGFDDAASARIEADQEQGLIPKFDARPVAVALNRLDASLLIHAFGKRPRGQPEPVRLALARIWISTLYGSEWCGSESSNLVRND